MNSSLPAEVLDDLLGYVSRDVAAGFLEPGEIIDFVVELLAGEAEPEALRAAAVDATMKALEAHSLAQSQWPAVTDCDRLDTAFATLETMGIIARQNFSCCGTCGAGEILDEMDAATKQGRKVVGYAFYHAQDTESAADGYGLCLNYGTDQDDEARALEIARQIVDVLEAQGLTTAWDGTWNQRISVSLDWKRRRSHGAAV